MKTLKTKQQTRRHNRRPIRRRKRVDGYAVFRQRLKDLGFKDYDEYLASDVWKTFKAWYRSSKMPQSCLVCRSPNYVLHHWTYLRLGSEDLQDVIPLCEEHHTDLHKYMAKTGVKIDDLRRQFSDLFGLSQHEISKLMRPFFRRRIKPEEKAYRPIYRPASERNRPNQPPQQIGKKATKNDKPKTVMVVCPNCIKPRHEVKLQDGKCSVCRQRERKAAMKSKRSSGSVSTESPPNRRVRPLSDLQYRLSESRLQATKLRQSESEMDESP